MLPSIICFIWLASGFHFTNGLRLEISLHDISGSKSTARIACHPVQERLQNGGNERQEILWEGWKFGTQDRDILRERMPGYVLVPDIRVNSSESYRCVLLSKTSDVDKNELRKRIHRELSASVPAEFGSCGPGYRLDQDRCYPCAPGSYTSGQDTKCYLCPKDFYSSREAADSCAKCPPGTKTTNIGADSESKCLELDSTGTPVSKSSTVWMVIGICFLIFVVAICIGIAIVWFWWFKDKEYGNLGQRIIKIEKGDANDHIYDTVAEKDSADEHIYEEIGELDDDYEVPIKRKKDQNYVEIISSKDDHIYEEPIKRTHKPRKKSSEHIYETPIPKDQKHKDKKKSLTKLSSEHIYETPITKDQKHKKVKKNVPRKGRRSRSFDSLRKQKNKHEQSDEHIYEEIYNVSLPDQHSDSLARSCSHGFQPNLTISNGTKRSDYDQLAELILKASQSQIENNPFSSKFINFGETCMSVQELSKLIENILKKVDRKGESEKVVHVDEKCSKHSVRSIGSLAGSSWVRKVKSEDLKKQLKKMELGKSNLKKISRKDQRNSNAISIQPTSSENEEYYSETESIPNQYSMKKQKFRETSERNNDDTSDTDPDDRFD